MKYLPLTQGKAAVVDDDVYDWLNQWKWHLASGRYAARDVRIGKLKRKIYMHVVVNETPEGFDTDHINQNKLDNRRSNLRTLTRSQNMRNCLQVNNTSGFRGVSWHKQRRKWAVRAKVDGRYKSLGLYNSPEEASMVYQKAIAEVM